MKKSTQISAMLYFFFAMFLVASGALFSYGYAELSTIVSYLGFALPLIAFIVYVRRESENIHLPVLENKEGLILSLPFIFISLLGVMGLSFLTNLLLGLFGKSGGEVLTGNIIYLLSRYAFLPAVLEELLFRLVPLTLIAPHSKKSAIILSSIMFSLVHCNLFEIPYALFAGFLYMLVDIMAGSVIPSIILHLVNNVIAILWQIYFVPYGISNYVLAIIIALAVISLFIVLLNIRRYKPYLKEIFDKRDKLIVDNASLIFIIFFSCVSIFSIF